MRHTVVHVPGDGIGPEVTWAARRVLDAVLDGTGGEIDWVDAEAGEVPYARSGVTVPPETVAAIREVGVVLKGPMANPVGRGYTSPNIALRQAAGVHANVRLAWALPGARTHFPGTDLVVVREVTEDVFTGATQYVGPDAAITVKWVTRAATHRVTRFAFEYARTHGRKRITVAHKAATLKETDGLFLAAAREIAPEYPDVELDDCLVDALAMHLVRDLAGYDMLLAPFQYGDILADLCAGLVGGLGLVPGASFGPDVALFEAAHGSAPKYAGMDKVNPTALVLSGALLLDHLGEHTAAARVRAAVAATVAGPVTTYDLGGTASTTEMTESMIEALRSGEAARP